MPDNKNREQEQKQRDQKNQPPRKSGDNPSDRDRTDENQRTPQR
jgi:hypothetical protein